MAGSYNISEEELNRIENYLQGNMTAAEKNVFEKELDVNAELKNKCEELKLLLIGISEASLQEKLGFFHKEIKPAANKSSKVISLNAWLITATAAAACCLGVWLMFFNTAGHQKLFTAYYKPDAGLPTVMSISNNYTFDKAMVDYKNEKYEDAVKAWTELLKTNNANDTLNYFIGSALLANKNEKQAITYLKAVADNGGSAFQKEASWYTGLAYLQTGDETTAKKYIKTSAHKKKEELLKELP